jgi:predicted transglutaminase-like cysteine proteinase
MISRSAIAAVILGVAQLLSSAGSLPANAAQLAKADPIEKEYGNTLPPIGYLQYCAETPQSCADEGRSVSSLALNPDRWQTLYRVNRLVNNLIQPVSDMVQYGKVEHWAIPTDKGDCEDYVLLKQRDLENLGFPASSLLITVVLDENGQGHAVLTVATADGDFILDNRRNDILRWNDTKYSFLKRQARENGRHWVALATQPTTSSGLVAAMPVNP